MPLVEVTLAHGRTDDQVRALIHALHQAVLDTTGTRSEHIRVIVREVPRSHWATADVTLTEMDAAASVPDPERSMPLDRPRHPDAAPARQEKEDQ